ncbi:MAG: hypothetical protein AAF664_20475 [Planctomycetota bacterium]
MQSLPAGLERNAPAADSIKAVDHLRSVLSSNDSQGDELDHLCVDLIERKRHPRESWERELTALDYRSVTTLLSDDEKLLDVIDADLCVCEELKLRPKIEFYLSSLPQLRSQILELVRLCNQDWIEDTLNQPNLSVQSHCRALPSESSTIPSLSFDSHCQEDVSLGGSEQAIDPKETYIEASLRLIPAPEWFEPKQCTSAGLNHWLLRGRDTKTDRPMAMKVIALPAELFATAGQTASIATKLIDQCESAAKIDHASWVKPCLATVHQRYFGVVRPWHFGAPLPDHWFEIDNIDASATWRSTEWIGSQSAIQAISSKLLNAASIIDALATAHRGGIFHGALHHRNMIALHDGSWHLMDAGTNARAIAWIGTDSIYRQKRDLADAIRWISGNLAIYPCVGLQRGIGTMWHWLHLKPEQTLERLSDWLNALADRGPSMVPKEVDGGTKRFFGMFR